jgi:diguanylate cyclase (GGDEF)-like protein
MQLEQRRSFMSIDILKYLWSSKAPKLSSRAVAVQASRAKDDVESFVGKPDGQAIIANNGWNAVKLDNLGKRYSLSRLLLTLALSIALCGFLIKHLFIYFPKLHLTDMPLIGSLILIVLLSPVLYVFLYRPMVMQFDKLKKAEGKMQEFAFHDMLTGLYNRRGFLTYAEHLLKLSDRTKRGLILIYADLDNFKRINDDYGHEKGDGALVCIASVLKKTFRNSDVLGRVGGDEFAILALEAKAESLDALRKRLNENLKKTKYNIDSKTKLTFSLGIIYYNPEKPQTMEELLRRADMLMYDEKFQNSVSPHLAPSEERSNRHGQ